MSRSITRRRAEALTRAQTPNAGGAPVTKERSAACDKCHGEGGVSTTAITPSLAGQDATYALDALRAYKDGTRDDDVMSPKAKKLDDAEMKNFAAYYAGLDPKPLNILKPLSPDEWAEKCDRCHGVNGNSARPEVPALAAQRQDYLEAVLEEVSVRRPQEPRDGGDVEHPDRGRRHRNRSALRTSEAAGGHLRPRAGQMKDFALHE